MNRLQTQVKYLLKESAIQHEVITQLVKLVSSRQLSEAKPNLKCVFGHSCCRINHTKFNIVKPVSDIVQWDSSCTRRFTNSFEGSLGKERIAKLDTDAVHQDGKMLKLKKNAVLQDKALIKKLLRQADKSQLKWSVPPIPVLVNLSDIVPEIFASLWDNVYYLLQEMDTQTLALIYP